jgi:hypothetical protein
MEMYREREGAAQLCAFRLFTTFTMYHRAPIALA